MILVGLTGGIGAGKSTVSARLREKGAVVIDADRITRQLQQPGKIVFRAMVDRFGTGIVSPDGTLDRPAVAGLVFSDAEALADLNAIVHPAVGAEIATQLAEEAGTDHVVVLDVPLLVESGRSDLATMVVVDLDPELAVKRLVEERGMDETDARARIASQASREERRARADIVIDNAGSLDDLDSQIDRAWAHMVSLPQSSPAGG